MLQSLSVLAVGRAGWTWTDNVTSFEMRVFDVDIAGADAVIGFFVFVSTGQ